MKRLWAALFLLALVWVLALLHRGQPLGWDEIEFFRATRWIAEGQVPFRDFWEHHTPLQWMVFAPMASFADGPGAASIVTMRWAQLALWLAIVPLVMRLARGGTRWWALVFLLASPLFVRSAVEYRVDALGNLGYIAAIALVLHGGAGVPPARSGHPARSHADERDARRERARRPPPTAWLAFGALMSIAVLANMRLAPLVIATAGVMLFWGEQRWAWNPRALWMLAGVAGVGLPFIGWLGAVDAWQPFLDGVVGYNVGSERLMQMSTLGDMLLAPVWLLDPAAIALWGAAIAGCVLALREIRLPGPPQIVAILFLASILAISLTEVQYEYHFQTTYLLMVPLAALAFARVERWRWLAFAIAAVALLIDLLPLASPSFGNPMRYQDAVMTEVDRRTRADDVVFDGTGYALRRKPAYRYWFLPVGLRFLANRRAVELYDIAANPPAAVIYNTRLQRWFEIFPQTAAYATLHYVPRFRNLWVPGMTATLAPGRPYTWRAPAAGRYTLWASDALLRHPWFSKPLQYAAISGPAAARYGIPLQRLPLANDVQWIVDGNPVAGRTADLRKGSRVAILSRETKTIGVLLVPSDITTLALGPEEEFQF